MDIPFYPPSYNGELLHSFGQGKRARQRFTEIRGSSLPGLRIKQGDLIPEEGCELVCILKPLMRMTKRGGMSSSGPSKQKYHRANEVAVKLGVNWYYLGRYRCAKEDNLDASGYHALSSGAKQALVQSCGPKKHHTTIEAKLWSGDIAVRRYHLRREGFNEDLYRRLLDAAAGGKLDVADGGAELGSDGADESGDADE
ncbi:uncharacterized protein PHACADRAFT_249137 [Phanerochaete carnosa HHB-10118-sp]|uniref:Uncharacterized protein n=1 Tax=Phanerochaete carnosa (strain HHB-10118-sp) TaxID=650164 RepID=K5WI02_PHACS|nr:uncharacterized protein PHACADRAFT_249137 [Phanerochaete carnosa HHB-10118-sp]EKM58985.1 hypothetical protein PHACADRAFT_249137 [Phanerochaete carnosa HHB-10118-sp]